MESNGITAGHTFHPVKWEETKTALFELDES
jgi:hypothetical protein